MKKLDTGTQSRLEMWKERLFYASRAATCQFDVSDAKGLLELVTEIEKYNEFLFRVVKDNQAALLEDYDGPEFERHSRDLPRVRGDRLRDPAIETENLSEDDGGVYSD